MFTTENIEHLAEVLRIAGELHIAGPTASGKTTLANAVAAATGLPVVAPRFSGPGPGPTGRGIAAGVEDQEGSPFVHLLDHGEMTPEGRLTYPGVGPRVPGELRIEVTGRRPSNGYLVPTACIDASRRATSSPSGELLRGPRGAVVRAPGGLIHPPQTPSELLTIDELACQLGVTPLTVDRWRRQGSGPAFVQVGRGIRYLASDVDAWITANRTDPAA